MRGPTSLLVFSLLGILFTSCARPIRAPVAGPQGAMGAPRSHPRLTDDADVGSLRTAVEESITWLRSRPQESVLVFGPRSVRVAELRGALEALHAELRPGLSPEALEALIRRRFDVLEAAGGDDGEVLFTGYYEPLIEASLERDATHTTPILARPDDLIEIPLEPFAERFKGERMLFGRLEGNRVVPYWSRAQLRARPAPRNGGVLAWAKDSVALFFLEIQGSGSLRFPDGTERKIGYASSNGRPYRSIGSLLIQEGAITQEAMSMQALRAWLAAHPDQQQRVLDFNESAVFFRYLDGAPVGSLGRPVTPGRSIATDAQLFPKGALAFLSTERPTRDEAGQIVWRPLNRFVLNQDTGGAIKGAGRVDVFWGRGEEAELAAGLMKQKGRLYFLVPKSR